MIKQYLRIALLFTILIGITAIAYGQPSTPRDTCTGIHYTDAQDMRCLECLVNAPKKDSIVLEQKKFIEYQEGVIKEAWKDRDKAKKKKKNSTIIGASIGAGGGIVLGILIRGLIK